MGRSGNRLRADAAQQAIAPAAQTPPKALLSCACAAALALAGCGGSGGAGAPKGSGSVRPGHTGSAASGTSATALTLDQVRSNLERAGYRITVYTPGEGVLYLDSQHKADAGMSIDYSPGGQQLYASVYQTSNPAVRRVLIAKNSDEAAPIVRGNLVFTISGTEPELQAIVKDAGDLAPTGAQPGSATETSAAKAAVQRFIDVYAAGDEKSVCASLTAQVLRRSHTFCDPSSIFYKRKPDPRVRGYKIDAVTTSGPTAAATVSFAGVTEQLALRKEGGQWKIDTQLGAGHLF